MFFLLPKLQLSTKYFHIQNILLNYTSSTNNSNTVNSFVKNSCTLLDAPEQLHYAK